MVSRKGAEGAKECTIHAWICTLKHLSLIRKYGVHDEAYLGRQNNRFAIHAASYLCKGYYRDTKLPFRVRQQR